MKETKQITGWGRFQKTQATVFTPTSIAEVGKSLEDERLIARGAGLSYGDSSLAPVVLETNKLTQMTFDQQTGQLVCESGVKLNDILNLVVPLGWFLPVTPGTSLITVGGAIASDCHGKNHSSGGTFSQYVESLELLLGSGEKLTASRSEASDLFHATCGGMGLTGIILSCKIQLKPISSCHILQTAIKVNSLEELLKVFKRHGHSTYSVAWIDGLASGKNLGRSILYLGEHGRDTPLKMARSKTMRIPFQLPFDILNFYSVKIFNFLYLNLVSANPKKKTLNLKQFFYPLDRIKNWNILYGDKGFIQYQFVVPETSALEAIKEVFTKIQKSREIPCLCVLKLFGVENKNLLSFPISGFSLALDFKVNPGILALLPILDQIVLSHGGRIYLAKDAVMSEETFKSSYPRWEEFQATRHKYQAIGTFASHQSKRLGLE
jgi:FAD/FMN-containing dehydrogenase